MTCLRRRSVRAAIAVLPTIVAVATADRALAKARTILPPRACVIFAEAAPIATLAHYVYVFGAAGRSSTAIGQDAELVPAAVRGTAPDVEAGAAPPIDRGPSAAMRPDESEP